MNAFACALWISFGITNFGHADQVANTGGAEPAPAVKINPPRISELKACAQSVGRIYFDHDLNSFISWSGLRMGEIGNSFERPSVAETTMLSEGLNGHPGPGLLTISKEKVYYTPITFRKNKLGYMSTHVTLNIGDGRVDPKHHLPIVDPGASDGFQSFYQDVTLLSKDHYMAMVGFWELQPEHDEIAAKDSLTGEAATNAVGKWLDILKLRIEGAPARIRSLHASIPDTELNFVQQGLCTCESIAPKVVESTRKLMIDRNYPVTVRSNKTGETRRIDYGDLSCGMV